MAKAKPKNTEHPKLKSPAPVSGLKPNAAGPALDDFRLEEFWKQELVELTSVHFASLDAAIDSIVQRVGDRIDPSGSDLELRGFLRVVLSTDPSIAPQLRQTLRISG